MTPDNYIIVGSDYNPTLTGIINELEELKEYHYITVTSITLLKQLLFSIKPELIILSFKNNNIEINQLHRFQLNEFPPIICLTNRFERFNFFSEKIPIILQPLDVSLKNKFLINNIRSILNLQKNRKNVNLREDTQIKESGFISQNKNLARHVLELDQKKELLKKMTDRIKELFDSVDTTTKVKLNSIINNVKLDTSTTHWDDFKIYFENINPSFISQLSKKYPCLTSKDIKYCCYLKMNMSNEDIRYILGINKESVRTHKYRLKKKMILKKEQDLRKFINLF